MFSVALNPKTAAAGKEDHSTKENKLLFAMIQSMKDTPKYDWEKVAKLGGYVTAKAASCAWFRVKKGHEERAAATGEGSPSKSVDKKAHKLEGDADDEAPPAKKARASKKTAVTTGDGEAGKSKKRASRTVKAKAATAATDGETEIPKKKSFRTPKPKAAATDSADSDDVESEVSVPVKKKRGPPKVRQLPKAKQAVKTKDEAVMKDGAAIEAAASEGPPIETPVIPKEELVEEATPKENPSFADSETA